MDRIDVTPEDQERILRDFLAQNHHGVGEADSIRRPLIHAVAQCHEREEFAVGIALVQIMVARGGGWEHDAAWLLLELSYNRIRAEGSGA